MGFKNWIARKALRWSLPTLWKELTGKDMQSNPDDHEVMIDAIKEEIELEVGHKFIKKSWWDSFIDGINRLVRPLFSFSVLIFLWYAVTSREGFQEVVLNLSAIPLMGWTVILTVLAFWFGERIVKSAGGAKNLSESMDPDNVKERLDRVNEKLESNEEFLKRIRREDTTMSEKDILRWNRIKNSASPDGP